ncbi:uncharacterized protein LOC119391983 [Rhipicephalus sanguineus]|uniref:uncharacterized protein LOC119391983 n=1 Tax=Rhipicephalus sanguineus TaxID=34632 RepID=UPI0018936818|nr:uncharacterized protein LOC119391983 [Rhipicephalus sanguineus]
MIVEMLQARSAPQPQKAQKSAPLLEQAQQSPTDLWEDGQDLNGLDYEVEPSHTAPTPPPPAHMDTTSKPAADALPTAADPKAHTAFTDIGDGKYHVKDGLMIGSKQAEKILGHKKPPLVVKDMAQAIWGREGLAERSYGGKLAPKEAN